MASIAYGGGVKYDSTAALLLVVGLLSLDWFLALAYLHSPKRHNRVWVTAFLGRDFFISDRFQ